MFLEVFLNCETTSGVRLVSQCQAS